MNKTNKKMTQGGQRSNPISRDVVASGPGRRPARVERGVDLLVSSVAGSVSFDANRYEVNPGLSARFASLSNNAKRADKYRFRKLFFRYVPTQAVTTTTGMIGLALELNPNQGPVDTQSKFQAYEHAVTRSAYSAAVELHVPKQILEKWRFVRRGPVPFDLSRYDPIALVVATLDEANTNKIGFVEAHYEIEFMGNQLDPTAVRPTSTAVYNLSSAQTLTTATPATALFDELVVDSIGGDLTSGVYTPNEGAFMVISDVCFVDSAAEAFQGIAELFKNGAAVSPPQKDQFDITSTAGGAHQLTSVFFVQCDSDDTLSIRVTATGAAGTLTLKQDNCRLWVKSI